MMIAAAPVVPRDRSWTLPALAALLVVVGLASCLIGSVSISLAEMGAIIARELGMTASSAADNHAEVLLAIRLPRVLLGALVGAALGTSGAAMQGIFRNPLVDPGLLGVSAGAALGAVASIVLGAKLVNGIPPAATPYVLPIAAFAGAIAVMIAAPWIARVEGRTVTATLLLAGIAVNALASALTGLFMYASTDAQLRTITFWSLGSLGGATWRTSLATGLFAGMPLVVLVRFGRPLNALVLGEAEAGHLGIDVERTKRIVIPPGRGHRRRGGRRVGHRRLRRPRRPASPPPRRRARSPPPLAGLGAPRRLGPRRRRRPRAHAGVAGGAAPRHRDGVARHAVLPRASHARATEARMMIEARSISHAIGKAQLLSDVSLAASPGEILVLVGPNGAGKSTLLRILAGEMAPTAGEVRLAGRPVAEWSARQRAERRAVLPQHAELSFPFSAYEVVLLGRTPHVVGHESQQDHAIARHAMAATDTRAYEHRGYPTLSGGERQRVQAARVVAQIWDGRSARVLLLDEPTASLDLAHQHAILRLARRMADDRCAVVCVLHDLNLAAQYATTLAVMHRGRLHAFGPPARVLSPALLADVFDVDALVVPHPELACPLVVSRGPLVTQGGPS